MSDASRTGCLDDARRTGRAERRQRTAELLAVAHACEDAQREALLDQVVKLNRGVAEAIAFRYRGRGVSSDDLEEAACKGLIKAVHRFDPTVGAELLTYAVPSIRGEVQRCFRDHDWKIRPLRPVHELEWRTSRRGEHWAAKVGHESTRADLAVDLDHTTDAVDQATQAFGSFRLALLDQLTRDHDGETRFDPVSVTATNAQKQHPGTLEPI